MATTEGRNFVERLRQVIYSLWDKETGELRDIEVSIYLPKRLSEKRKRVLRRLVMVLMQTDFIKDETVKEYLSSYGDSYEDVGRRINANPARIKRKVFYYCSVSEKWPGKLMEKFGDLFLVEIMDYPGHDITRIEQAINQEYIKYFGLYNLQDELVLEIPYRYQMDKIEDAEFNEFKEAIKPYTKREIERVKKSLTVAQRGYFWFLVNNQYGLQGKDLERFKELKALLGITDASVDAGDGSDGTDDGMGEAFEVASEDVKDDVDMRYDETDEADDSSDDDSDPLGLKTSRIVGFGGDVSGES